VAIFATFVLSRISPEILFRQLRHRTNQIRVGPRQNRLEGFDTTTRLQALA
jgi:hypothetical protein